MPRNFSPHFHWRCYDEHLEEAVIVLEKSGNGDDDSIRVLDPVWLRNSVKPTSSLSLADFCHFRDALIGKRLSLDLTFPIGFDCGNWVRSGDVLNVVNVYGPHNALNKQRLWKLLCDSVTSNGNDAWVLCGDFNEVRMEDERLNCNFIESRAKKFNDEMKYTRISDDGLKFSKLDRFLVNDVFHTSWTCLSVVALDRKQSDHCPIVLKDDDKNFGAKPIKVFDDWLDIEGAEQVIKEAWDSCDGSGPRKDCCLRNKMKKTKLALKELSQQKLGNLDGEIEAFKGMANSLELKAKSRLISDEERAQWLNARKESLQKEKIKVNMLKQKARVKWIVEGDENSKFFHALIRRGYNRNNIRGLSINGVWSEDPFEIKEAIFNHYKGRFEDHTTSRPSLGDLSYPSLTADEAKCLETIISEEEILEAINGCGNNKAPGPDGFNFRFFKKFWDVIKGDVFNAISWFWSNGEFSRGCNASFVTLIPKKKSIPSTLVTTDPLASLGVFTKSLLKSFPIDSGRLCQAEGLTILTKAAVDRGLFKGVEIGMEKIKCKKSPQYILKCFELASGLKVNLQKSCLYGVGVSSAEVDVLARLMGCQAGKFPFIYLGLPIGAKMKKLCDWAPVIDKFKKKLSEWKMKTLSYGGRLTLLKSVLSSLPLYYFSLFRAPPCVLKILESVRRNFFWGGDLSGSKISWVKWDNTLLPYGSGGLNIGSLKSKNLALLGKWWWRFKTETNCFWTKFIRSIYGIDGCLRSGNGFAHISTSGTWRNIILAGSKIEMAQIPFLQSFKKSIGDGRSTLFWKDVWCGSMCFQDLFPRLFRLECNKDVAVRDRLRMGFNNNNNMADDRQAVPNGNRSHQGNSSGVDFVTVTGSSSNNSVSFNWCWSRVPTGRTATELEELSNLLRSVSLDVNGGETWSWSLAKNGIFTVKKLAHLIDQKLLSNPTVSAQQTLCNNLVPKKVEIFVWRLMKKRIPVRIELDKRGVDLHSIRCPVCDEDLESVDHSIVSCKFAMDIWSRLLKWWNVAPSPNHSLHDLLLGKSLCNMSAHGLIIWQAVLWTCAYHLWKNRNLMVFQNKAWSPPVVLNEIQVRSYEWITNRVKGISIDWLTWLTNPSLYLGS
ncbi:uncharacterized protein [Rutidosis leptorrhynchoides]|uniref:uncharacterized protein n=1 Tax=Rutidosis leptorrhynchoides TaxID=125765 RepID=UPI003A997FEA